MRKFFLVSGYGLGGGPLCKCSNSDFLTVLLLPLGLKILYDFALPSSLFLKKYCPGST